LGLTSPNLVALPSLDLRLALAKARPPSLRRGQPKRGERKRKNNKKGNKRKNYKKIR